MESEVPPEVTLAFYKNLYPFKPIFQWLNHQHEPTKLFMNREFAFTLQGDIYVRFQSFANADELKREVCRMNPSRFEIGAVYSAKPRDKKTIHPSRFNPQRRELVFDIDMTDYDEIRTCCSGKGICKRCWGFIAASVELLDHTLRDHFGFKHLLWIYSGRRGIHCWVSDSTAIDLTDDERRVIVNYLEVVKGSSDSVKKVNVRGGKSGPLHPMLSEAVGILGRRFGEVILDDQDCFRSEEGWQRLLELIPDQDLVAELHDSWSKKECSSGQKWEDIVDRTRSLKNTKRHPAVKAAVEDIVLQYIYPRIDSEVSKHRNHLLKAPFCVHPSTGRVCVPVDPQNVWEFDPEKVPTVHQYSRNWRK
jgi:DNA primase small subunit